MRERASCVRQQRGCVNKHQARKDSVRLSIRLRRVMGLEKTHRQVTVRHVTTAVAGDVAAVHDRASPEWAARKEFSLTTMVAEEGTSKTRRLWLQKQRTELKIVRRSTQQLPAERLSGTPTLKQRIFASTCSKRYTERYKRQVSGKPKI